MKKVLKILYYKINYISNKIIQIIQSRRTRTFLKKLIGSNQLVFDVGANIGAKTEIFSMQNNRVISIEPQSNLCKNLKIKFSSNSNIIIENSGISDQEGELILNISSKYNGFSSFDDQWQKNTKYDSFDTTEKVKVTTLDNLIKKYGLPYYCKIDVEGFEEKVLTGLSQKIPLISFEFHSSNFSSIEKCMELLQKLGYEEFNYDVSEKAKFKNRKWMKQNEFIEIIKNDTNIHKDLWGDIYCR